MYSTGNSTQYSMITYMGKEPEKEWTYVYVYLNHFAVYLKLTQHCKSTTLQYKIKIKGKKNQTEEKRNYKCIKVCHDTQCHLQGITQEKFLSILNTNSQW